MNGKIARIVAEKNFGFITGTDGVDYFFHKSALINESSFDKHLEKRSVTFEAGEATKGPRAESVYVD